MGRRASLGRQWFLVSGFGVVFLRLFRGGDLLGFLFGIFSSFFTLFLHGFDFGFLSVSFVRSFGVDLFGERFVLFRLLRICSVTFH